jgi:hydroxymethylglutaryl-CoA reductase (NADPH)
MRTRSAHPEPAVSGAFTVETTTGPSDHVRSSATRHGVERIPARGLYTEAARLQRLEWIRASTGAPLDALQSTRLNAGRLTGNVENFIGAVEVPVGLAGPLRFRGHHHY